MKTEYRVDPSGSFAKALAEARKRVRDLTPALRLIADDFYRTQRPLFEKRGPGGYSDLSPRYKQAKKRDVGFVYPMLVRSGRLQKAATNPSDANASFTIVDKNAAIFGVKLAYAKAVQKKRPFMFLGPEQRAIATPEQIKRPERWASILRNYVVEVTLGRKAS